MKLHPELMPSGRTVSTQRRAIGNLVVENIPEIPPALSAKVNQYLQSRQCVALGWLSDGSGLLISTRQQETPQVHLIQEAGGVPEQLTFFAEPINNASPNPHAGHAGFLFLKDQGGSEHYQLHYYDLEQQQHQALTTGQSKTDFYGWHPQKNQIVFTSNHRNEVDYDFYIKDLSTSEPAKLLLAKKGYWYPLDWSPDGKRLLIGNYCSINESYLFEYDLETKTLSSIREAECKAIAYRTAKYSLDGQMIYLSSDYQSQFQQLKAFCRETQTFHAFEFDIPWDVYSLKRAPHTNLLAFACNTAGSSAVYLLDPQSGHCQSVESLPYGIILNMHWHPQQLQLALTIDRPDQPADVYVYHHATNKMVQWTDSAAGSLAQGTFVHPKLISYPTFDQLAGKERRIPAFYYKPPTAKKRHPVLIYIHGGPESQYRPNFNPTFQYYLRELGVAVIAPNVRGSLGYGKDYLKLDNGYKREDSVRDIGHLLDWIEQQPELDADRVAVFGGSYGGYMVLASMTHYNRRLRCGIDIVGISNFITFLENTKSYRRELRRVEYGDERDPAMRKHLNAISPLTNAHKIQKPMLIVQGLNDPRVPVGEAEQMVSAIRQNGGEAWYLLAKDEGHGFRKKFNRDYFTKVVMLFLQKYLLADDA